MAPSRISLDITLFQTQGDSAVSDTKVFYNSNSTEFPSSNRRTREREREREREKERERKWERPCKDLWSEIHLPLHSNPPPDAALKGSVNLNSASAQIQLAT